MLTTLQPFNINSEATFNFSNVDANVVSSTGNITALGNVQGNYIIGNGSSLTNINGANVSGEVSYATVANSVSVSNVSGIGNIATLNLDGNAGNILYGNGVFSAAPNVEASNTANYANYANFANVAYNVSGSNVTGQVSNALVAGTVYTNAQPNITSLGTLTGLNVTGNVSAGNANLGNLVTANFVTGTLTTASQPNITSLGTLSSITTSGNIQTSANVVTDLIVGKTSSVTITATGTDQNVNLTPTGTGTVNVGNFIISNIATPINPADAATKQYVDDVAQGLHTHDTCNAATQTTLAIISGGTVTYNNGASGVGATLTTTGTYTTIDGVTLTNGMRILVKDEANAAHNGIYDRTSSTVLTRSADFNTPVEMAGGDFTFVNAGTVYDNSGWVMSDPVITVGTSPVNWIQFSGAGTYTAGTGLTLNGSTFNIANTTVVAGSYGNGDYNATFTVNGQGQISAAANVAITANAANLSGTTLKSTVVNSSLTSVGTLNSLTVTGNITAPTFVGAATNLSGGSAGTVPYQSAANTTAQLAAGTSGQVLRSNGAAAPLWSDATNTNTANAVVVRDANGDFLTGGINTVRGLTDTSVATSVRVVSPGGAAFSSSVATGALQIQLPTAFGNGTFLDGAIRLRITVSTYDGQGFDLLCGAWPYRFGTNIGLNYSFAYMVTGTRPAVNIRWGWDGTRWSLFIGNIGDSWSYPLVNVTEVQVGQNSINTDLWRTGWNIQANNSGYGTVYGGVNPTILLATTSTNLAGGSAGTIPYQSAANTTVQLAAGTSGQVLRSNGAAAPAWANATTTNTANAFVVRDASGNFSAGTITATLSGAATTAGTVTTAAQGNITSVGTLTGLTLSGLLVGATSAGTDVNTNNDGGSFSARGNTTTVASMSFHRAGAYAINMGLGTDNVFRIGGWSASSNALQLTGTGALSVLSTISAGGTITGTSFSGAGTGLTGTASSLSVGGSATFLNSGNYINRTVSSGNANTDFQNTPAGTTRIQGDDAGITNGAGGSWWFYQNMRHSNATNYWGTQVAWGWEDNANKLRTRNITSNTFGAWVEYLNTSGATFTGSLTMSGNITAYSDERLKTDWGPVIESYVERLAAIKSGTYSRTDTGDRQAGISAQDCQKLLPEAVKQDDEGYLSIAYGNAALVSAVELAKRVVEQEERIKKLEALVEKLLAGA